MNPFRPCPSRPARARRPFLRLAGLILALALPGRLAAAPAPVHVRPAPPVELVETRPIETLLGNPALPSALGTWLGLIEGARRSLDFEEFYFSTWPQESMDDVVRALGDAARRGVRVRLILDAGMYRTYPRIADSLGHQPGFQVRLVDFHRIAGGVQHAKYFLVDGQTVFLGSQNLDWRSLKHIHELGVRIRDRRVAGDFQRVFDLDWGVATPLGQTPDTTHVARVVPLAHAPGVLPYRIAQAPGDTVLLWPSWSPQHFSPDTTLWDRDRIVQTLDRARHEVVVQVLTYSPAERRSRDDALDAALRRAAGRGVRVRLVVSDWETDSPTALKELQSLARVPGVEVKLSTVPEWSGGYIPFARVEHCKYFVADTLWTWVGTSNWEPGYFHGTRNVAVTLMNRRLAAQARAIFAASWDAPGAAVLQPDSTYAPKVRGEEPPPGRKKYGG
jgi:phosphatidylserine/phosphatidylglycerophosphate/cardiolipin synthase-like enzyme